MGKNTIRYLSGTGVVQAAAIDSTFFTSWSMIDGDGSRFLLGDQNGILYVLVLLKNANNVVVNVAIDLLGSTSISQCLSYLDEGVAFVGSVYGDSQLIKLKKESDADGSHIDILDTYTNIGPILDMCVVESDKQGLSQIVTCSGAFKDGSLRVVRSGIGIQEQASVEIEGIKGIWSLRSMDDDLQFDKYLVQSFIGETRVLAMQDEELSEFEIPGFAPGQTLHCANIGGGYILQVTAASARLINSSSLMSVAEFFPSNTITVAVSTDDQLIVSLAGGEIVYFDIDMNSPTPVFNQIASTTMNYEIACLSMRPLIGDISVESRGDGESMELDNNAVAEQSASTSRSNLLAVGTWTENAVMLIALPTLQVIAVVKLDVDIQARDLMLVTLERVDYLLIGLGDGTLITYIVQYDAGLPTLQGRRKVTLGTHPISLNCFVNHGALCVFASCDRSSVIYSRNSKLLFSVVNIPDCTDVTPFHSKLFPDCLATSSEVGFMIGSVETEIQKVHIQSHYIGQAPRRICYSNDSDVYAVCAQRTELTDNGEQIMNRVLFFDGGSMEQLPQCFELDPMEEGLSLLCTSFDGSQRQVIIVGTAYSIPDEYDPLKGRILVFEIDSERRPTLMAEREVKGAVYSLAQLPGRLVAGINAKVEVFKWVQREDGTNSYDIHFETAHLGHIIVLHVKTHGNYVLVGDLLRSVTLLHFDPATEKLTEISRDFNTNFVRSIFMVSEDEFMFVEDKGNLVIMKKPGNAATEEEKGRLMVESDFHLGDFVNTIQRGSLNSQPQEQDSIAACSGSYSNADKENNSVDGLSTLPTNSGRDVSHLFGTVTGMIGTVMVIPEESYNFFSALEKAMKTVVSDYGGFSHDVWREFSNGQRSGKKRTTVDGDLVERFLELDKAKMEDVVMRLNDDIRGRSSNVGNVDSQNNIFMSANEKVNPTSAPKEVFTVEEVIMKVEDMSRKS